MSRYRSCRKRGFVMRYGANNALARSAKVIVGIGETSHFDTLSVRQRGSVEPRLDVTSVIISLPGSSAGHYTCSLDTNIPDSDIAVDFSSDGEREWIGGVSVTGSVLGFDYAANPGSGPRHANIDLRYEDAFGNVLHIPFKVNQKSASDSDGTEYSFGSLCALAGVEGTLIEEDIVIEGIVVSDKENGNCGENTQQGLTSIDYNVCRQTVYLESTDGSRGLMLVTRTPEDNVFLQGDRVRFSLRGATLYRSKVIDSQTDPVYYYLTGIKGNMAVACTHLGREGIPVKEKYMGSLTDDDIFTFVSLRECEFPVRKGPLTPIAEQFTSVGGSDKVSKFGILLHDIFGSSMYLYTNTTCPYRRTGEALPYGSGTMKGVVVHELYPRFEYMDNASADPDDWGNIGRYQLRHTCREDFGMAKTMEEGSFSAIIAEWRYILDKNLERYYATDGDRSAYFEYSFIYPDSYTDGRAGKLPINKNTDYSYLGPLDKVAASGVGVVLDDGQDWMSPFWHGYNSEFASAINAKGNGEVPTDAGSAWSTNITARNGAPQYTTLVFSTSGLSSSKMSMQISSMNNFYSSTQNIGGIPFYLEGPRRWWVEYSLDGSNWVKVSQYSLPEFCQTSPVTQLWQTPGFKSVNIPLPTLLLGRDKVWIRIIPDAGLKTGSKTAYIDESIVYPASGSFPTAWNYIGIRYNVKDAPATDFGGGGIDGMNPIDYNW